MSERTLAGIIAVPLLIALWVLALALPVPVVTNRPGITENVLASSEGEQRIRIEGEQSYRDDGQLRLTTVYVTQPQAHVNLFDALAAWVNPREAVLPYDAVYGPEETPEQSKTEGQVQMVSSKDSAIAAALSELDYEFETLTEVLLVTPDAPADGKLAVEDQLLKVGDTQIAEPQDVVDAVGEAEIGEPIEFVVRRQGVRRTVELTPADEDGTPRVGITPGVGYEFPFQVTIDVDEAIGGPSAGLMFSLGILDVLTPGSLTDGKVIAGTGTITDDGQVGPIGGIQQKIPAADRDGAELFLVPPLNCADALAAEADDLRLVRTETLAAAREAIETWVADPDADLPSCEDAPS